MTNPLDKSEMLLPCPSIDVRASILTTIKANREAGESREVLTRDLTTLFHKLFASSRLPADQVPELVERVARIVDRGAFSEFAAKCEKTRPMKSSPPSKHRETGE